jgi:hypothetical protein
MGWFGGYVLDASSRVPGGYESLVVGTTVTGLSAGKIKPVSGPYANKSAYATLLSLDDGDIRFRIDGGSPGNNSGHFLTSGDALMLTGTQSLNQFRAVQVGETSATLRVTYFY